MVDLHKKWLELIEAFTADENLAVELWQEIEEAHSAPERHYHNLDHLRYMAEKLQEHGKAADDKEILLFSIFYHDIIYDVKRQDNEKKSARLAAERLKSIGVDDDRINKCTSQILATKEHKIKKYPDTALLLDLDLMILGEDREVYAAYAENIRREFKLFPDFLYNKGRRDKLQQLLNLKSIYKTERIRQQYEALARENIEWELSQL